MTEKGYSWPEAMLTLMITMMIFGTLLPFASSMTRKLDTKKIEMIAAEIALEGIIIYNSHALTTGNREVDQISYEWYYDGTVICVSYREFEKVSEKCISP